MVLGLRPLLAVFVILWLSFQQCCALDNSLPWRLDGGNEILESNQLMECETLNISFSPEMSNTLRGKTSYYVLAFEPSGMATMSFVGDEPSSLRWTIQRPAGTQLFVALLDSFGTSLGVLPDMYAVIPGSKDCLTKSESPGTLEATEPKITLPVFGRLIPCGPWEVSFSGGKPPYSVSIVALKYGSVYDYSVPSGEHILPYAKSGGGLPGKAIVIVGDANSMLGTTHPIIDIAEAKDTPSAGTSEAFSRCRPAQPSDMPFCLREPPRPTAFRFRRSFSDHPHMQLSRDLVTINSSYGDTIAVAVCVSLGGTGIVAMVIYVIMMYRRRQEIMDAQDTLPRPFEVTVPAATTTGASMTTHGLISVPMLNISPPRVYSQSGGKGRHEVRREETPTRTGPPRAGSAPIPTTTIPSQSQPGLSHDTLMQPHLSDTSLLLVRDGPSPSRIPPRSWAHSHTPTPPDPQSQSSSRVQPGQLSSSLPTGTQPQRTAGTPINRSASVRERRSAKHALLLSRSASELYRATSSVPRYRVPEYGSYPSSGRYAHRYDGPELHVDTLSRPTNHLRQWHSASPVVRVQHVCSDPEENMGGAIIFQHQDAGVMQELPPPYHKLVRSGAEV